MSGLAQTTDDAVRQGLVLTGGGECVVKLDGILFQSDPHSGWIISPGLANWDAVESMVARRGFNPDSFWGEFDLWGHYRPLLNAMVEAAGKQVQ